MYENHDIPNDDNNNNAESHGDGRNFSLNSSPTIDLNESDLGHFQGSNGFALGNERSITHENETKLNHTNDNESANSEGINPNLSNNQPLRRSERTSVFPNKYNEFVVNSKVKYGLEKFVGYSKLSYENFCFITELNKAVEPKTYKVASRSQH